MKAVPAPKDIKSGEVEPVEPEDVEKIVDTVDKTVSNLDKLRGKTGDNSVTGPATNMSPHRRKNGHA